MAVVRNLTTGTVLADRAELADVILKRMVGLLARSSFDEGEALVLPRCRSIHTYFMRFPIDVLFVKSVQGSRLKVQGKAGVVVKIVEHLKPFRFAWAMGADTVVELPAGTIARTSTQPGQRLDLKTT